jgi:hypothetical protein
MIWIRRLFPVAFPLFVVVIADVLDPLVANAWGIGMVPAVIAATWLSGWRGGAGSVATGMAAAVVLLDPPPWDRPARTVMWLVVQTTAIVFVDLARQARYEARHAEAVRRDQAERAARAVADRRAAFLKHAAEVLASSPDYETTLGEVASLAVPQIADLCVVDILEEDGSFTALAVAHADPAKAQLVRELRQLYPLEASAKFGPPRVLRTGRSLVFTEVQDIAVVDASIAASESRVARALGIHSTMAVPLLVGGRKLGVISFATTESGRRFVAEDLHFAEDLARRAAIAIDTARP